MTEHVLEKFSREAQRPLVILGGLLNREKKSVETFLSHWGVPIYAEAHSGLRESPLLKKQIICSGEKILQEGAFDGVLKIGSTPTMRYWRDLESLGHQLPVLSISRLPFSGMIKAKHLQRELNFLDNFVFPSSTESWDDFFAKDKNEYRKLISLLEEVPDSEPAFFYQLSKLIPKGANIFLGNSQPIRYWDLFALREEKGFQVTANRGANGIDGELSTFYGYAKQGVHNWAILGDLTTLYDLSAPWVLPQLGKIETNLVIINNKGGQLFSHLFKSPTFLNEHRLNFSQWANMWQLTYQQENRVPSKFASNQHNVLELLPNPETTKNFWKRFAR